MTTEEVCEQLTFADELLGSLVEQLQSPLNDGPQCADTLRQVVEAMRRVQDQFSAAEKPAVEQRVRSIRTRAAQLTRLLQAANAFRCNSLRMNAAGSDSYAPDGSVSYHSRTRSFQLEA
jgi:hypothetical protein